MRLRRGSSGSMLLRSGSKVQKLLRSGSKVQMLLRSGSKFRVKPEGPYTLRSSFTRTAGALHAALLPYTPKALPAPQVLYTRFSALNA